MKKKIHDIIFKSDTAESRFFDIILLILIVTSVILVMLESVVSINNLYGEWFQIAEWIITILFSIEYVLRIVTSEAPKKYIFSIFGIIDFLSVIPKYIAFFFVGTPQALLILRALRLMRVFRILNLAHYIGASNKLLGALKSSKAKISVFLMVVMVICIVLGTIMYLIEGAENGFTSIPRSVYWCIVTLTTVGFGDIAPHTPLGQFIASIVMIIGYGIIAVPTGIVSAEYTQQQNDEKLKVKENNCSNCGTEKPNNEASFCYVCGESLDDA